MNKLVLVTGPPGSGKTTLAVPLARRLELPLIAKDAIKEALLDTLGTGDLEWSRRLGAATFAVMFAVARQAPAAVLEAPFAAHAAPSLLALCERPTEIYCHCPADELIRRYASRRRHPGHVDHQRLEQLTVAATNAGPLGLGGPLPEVDTSGPVNVADVAAWVQTRFEVTNPAHGPSRRGHDRHPRTAP